MSENSFRIYHRFQTFIQGLNSAGLVSRNFLFFGTGWLIALFMMFAPGSNVPEFLTPIIYFYFLFKFVDEIHDSIKPFQELLLVVVFCIFGLHYLYLDAFLPTAAFGENAGTHNGFIFSGLQIFFLGIVHLFFSALLIDQGDRKKGILILLFFIGLLFGIYVNEEIRFLYWIIVVTLFFSLLKNTLWLESLSRKECWAYLLLIFILFEWFTQMDPFPEIGFVEANYSKLWFTHPSYLFLTFKVYLITLMVRIPGVLIFNHASLKRKLSIAGVFQSTIPQILQLAALVLIFYFFISGWQAQNLRSALQTQLKEIETGDAAVEIDYVEIPEFDGKFFLDLGEYKPVVSQRWFSTTDLAEKGVIEMQRTSLFSSEEDAGPTHFIYFKTLQRDSSEVLFLTKFDSTFLEHVGKKLVYLGGSSLQSYSIDAGRWPPYSNKVELWSEDRNIQIFPLAVPFYDGEPIKAPLSKANSDSGITIDVRIGFLDNEQISFGRVFLNQWSPEPENASYFTVDVIQEFTGPLKLSGMLQVILFTGIVYLLLNSIVIQNMTKFGSKINQTIVQKFGQLKQGIQEVSTGNLDYRMAFEGDDEFVELANHFNEMGTELKQTLAERREKDRLQYELQNARDVQLSLLPLSLPEAPGYQVAASLHTATEVGGDFYDMFQMDENRFLFTIGDVSGKGSSAALYMAQCMSLIRYSREFTDDPVEICRRLNNFFTTSMVDRQIFVTAIIGILDAKKHTLNYVRAGHNLPIFLPGAKSRKIKPVKSPGLGIGLTANDGIFSKSLSPVELKLKAGDTLLFYTDGVIEASKPLERIDSHDLEIEVYDEERLERLLTDVRQKTAVEIKREIEIDLQSFYAGHPRVDDHTLFILQRERPPKRTSTTQKTETT